MALLLSPVLDALSITGMVGATWVVDESHCLSEGECERIARVCVLCHVAKATKEGSSRNLTQDLGTKSGGAPKKNKKKRGRRNSITTNLDLTTYAGREFLSFPIH